MTTRNAPRHTSIRRKSIRAILLPTAIALAIIIPTLAIMTYFSTLSSIENRVQRLGTEHRAHMSKLLWQFDEAGIHTEMTGFFDVDTIVAVRVVDITGETYQITKTETLENTISRDFLLSTSFANFDEIGTLTIWASTDSVFTVLLRRLGVLLAAILPITLLVLINITRMLDRAIIAPILLFQKQLAATPSDWADLKLTRQTNLPAKTTDELDDLIGSVHQMRDQILASQRAAETEERRMAHAAQMLNLGYARVDPNKRRFIECDTVFADLYGTTPETIKGTALSSNMIKMHMNQDFDPTAISPNIKVFKNDTLGQTFEYTLKSGELRYIHQFSEPVHNAVGDVLYIDLVAHDVTNQFETQERLFQAQKTDAIGKLTGGVAHDFNNILAIVAGNLELIRNGLRGTAERELVTNAQTAVAKGAQITKQLLSFARQQPQVPIRLDLQQILADNREIYRTAIGDEIDLKIIQNDGLWATFADKSQFETVIFNLLVNARDSIANNGRITIDITNTQLDEDYSRKNDAPRAGQYVCVAISDNGTGMSETVIKSAFEPFFTTKEVGKGTGLGLSMAYGFAKQSDGDLKIYSENGHGTTVKLYLPRFKGAEQTKPKPTLAVHKPNLKGINILVVEDEESLRQIMVKQLTLTGLNVYQAYDEDTAISAAKQADHLDIVLSDVMLPGGGNGSKISEQIMQIHPTAKVIFMSGFTENATFHNGRLDAEMSFLQKPFSFKDLEALISQLLNKAPS